jgi:hypothetical protein
MILVLDFDGCLNNLEDKTLNRCVFSPDNAKAVAYLVAQLDAKIIISSSWGYLHHFKHIDIDGWNVFLGSHGIGDMKNKTLVVGVTDPRHARPTAILDALPHGSEYLVLDDEDMSEFFPKKNFFLCDRTTGLTMANAQMLVEKWKPCD